MKTNVVVTELNAAPPQSQNAQAITRRRGTVLPSCNSRPMMDGIVAVMAGEVPVTALSGSASVMSETLTFGVEQWGNNRGGFVVESMWLKFRQISLTTERRPTKLDKARLKFSRIHCGGVQSTWLDQ